MANQGRNKGLTSPGTSSGLLDLMPIGGTQSFPQMQVQITGFGGALTAELVNLFGPGDGTTPTFYTTKVGGGGQAHGKVQSAQSPFPPTMYNLQGTLTMQADANCKISMPVAVQKISFSREAENQETWDFEVDWTKSGQHVTTWNGSTISYSQPALTQKEVNDGSLRIDDPNYLATSAITHIFFPTLNYQDSASAAAIQNYLASATAPRSNLKVTTSQAIRIDDNAIMLLVNWAPNSTKDDKELPATVTIIDNYSLNSSARIGKVNGTASTLANFALRATTTQQLTAGGTGNYFTVTEFGLRTPAEDITFPGTFTVSDNNNLKSTRTLTIVSNNSNPSYVTPSGFKIGSSKTIQLTSALGSNNQWQTVVEMALTDSADEVTFPRSSESRSGQSPWRSAQAQIVNASSDLATQATSLWATFQSVAKAWGLTLTPLTDGKRCVVYEYADPGILVEGYTSGGGRYLKTKLNGTNPQVYIASNISRGSNLRKIQLAQQWVVDRPIRRFLLRRFLQGTTIPEQYPSQINGVDMPTIGNVNSVSFLGLSAGTALYEGPQYSTNIGLSGTLPFFMGYQFFADNAGIAQGLPDIWFRQPLMLATNYSQTGWTNVSSIGLADVVTPSSASFGAFTA